MMEAGERKKKIAEELEALFRRLNLVDWRVTTKNKNPFFPEIQIMKGDTYNEDYSFIVDEINEESLSDESSLAYGILFSIRRRTDSISREILKKKDDTASLRRLGHELVVMAKPLEDLRSQMDEKDLY